MWLLTCPVRNRGIQRQPFDSRRGDIHVAALDVVRSVTTPSCAVTPTCAAFTLGSQLNSSKTAFFRSLSEDMAFSKMDDARARYEAATRFLARDSW